MGITLGLLFGLGVIGGRNGGGGQGTGVADKPVSV